jgi:hypothetical protein
MLPQIIISQLKLIMRERRWLDIGDQAKEEKRFVLQQQICGPKQIEPTIKN